MAGVPTRLYLAGPMSGLPENNFPRFNRVAAHLRERGHEVFNPAENKDGGLRQSRAFYMRLDIPALIRSEGVVVLPDWHRSRGACLEVWLALDLGLPIFRCVDTETTIELERVNGLELRTLPAWDQAVPADALTMR